MGLWDDIKEKLEKSDKKEADYGLDKLIIKAECLPIYFNWYDFHRGKLRLLDPVLGNLKAQIKENRIEANKDRVDDKIREIHKIFDPVMETMKKNFLKEKDPGRAERIEEEYRKTEDIVNDLETRVRRWSVAGDQILCGEYNIPTARVIDRSYTFLGVRAGEMVIRGPYSKESIQSNIEALYEMEKKYEKYNNGRGLKALEEVVKKIDYWQGVHQEQRDNKQRLNELLPERYKPEKEFDVLAIPDERRPIQTRLGEIRDEKAKKSEAAKTNSIKVQEFSCQGRGRC
ncbi:MAG: hypothetical protein ACOX2N_08760 [Peptococcia bacterium]|jgi:hypothetical protein